MLPYYYADKRVIKFDNNAEKMKRMISSQVKELKEIENSVDEMIEEEGNEVDKKIRYKKEMVIALLNRKFNDEYDINDINDEYSPETIDKIYDYIINNITTLKEKDLDKIFNLTI